MRALVISGGGSKGAYAGGIAEYLIRQCKIDYDLFVGTSTGSLLLAHLALGEIESIKKLFTSVRNRDIFDHSPFSIINGKVKIHHWNILRMILRRQKTFGTSNSLHDLIRDNLSPAHYENLRSKDKEIVVSVSNFTTHHMEYKSSKEESYLDFCEWTWISANLVPFMSLINKNGSEYGDGGFGSQVPINEAIRRGATEIDVIVLRREQIEETKLPSTSPFDTTMKVLDFMHDQVIHDDIRLGTLEAIRNDVKLNFYYLPRKLTSNSLVFNPLKMQRWWEEGYDWASTYAPEIKHIEG